MALSEDPTANEIFDDISNEVANYPELSALQPQIDSSQQLLADLNSPSLVDPWRLQKWVFAVSARRVIQVVKQLIYRNRWGTQAWYLKVAKEFQYGYDLVLKDGVWVYDTIDVAARIVKYCAVNENTDRKVVFKLGKDDGNGNATPLSMPELTAFKKYMGLKKVWGTGTEFINANPDVLRIGFEVYVDPMVFYINPTNAADPLNGSLLLNPSVYPVRDAINTYIKNLSFNGLFVLNDLVVDIRGLAGVDNAVNTLADVKYGFFNYQSVGAMPGLQYRPFAGTLKISTAAGETLADLITYIPSNEQE